MQLIKLDLQHNNFFCPATGHHIVGPEHYVPSPAMVGMWHFEVLEDPCFFDDNLQEAWDTYWNDLDEDDLPDVPEFLEKMEASEKGGDISPNWVCFEITTRGMACGPTCEVVWYLIDMDYQEE